MLAIVVEGNLKAPFSIIGEGEGVIPFPGLLHFTLDTYLIMLSVKQGGIKYQFKVFGMTRPGIEPWSPRPLANTLFSRLINYLVVHIFNWTIWYLIRQLFFFSTSTICPAKG